MTEIHDATPDWAKLDWAHGEIDRLRNEVARRDVLLRWIAENVPGTLELCPYKLAELDPATESTGKEGGRHGDVVPADQPDKALRKPSASSTASSPPSALEGSNAAPGWPATSTLSEASSEGNDEGTGAA